MQITQKRKESMGLPEKLNSGALAVEVKYTEGQYQFDQLDNGVLWQVKDVRRQN